MSRQNIFLLIGLVLVGHAVSLYPLWRENPAHALEDGLMENLQVLELMAVIGLSAAGLVMDAHRHGRWPLWLACLAGVTVLLREVDVERLDLPQVLILLGSGGGRNLLIGLAWVLTLTQLWRRRDRAWPQLMAALRSPACLLAMAGVTCYVLGWPFDKGLLPLDKGHHLFVEELLESCATFLLALAALWLVVRPIPTDFPVRD